MIPHRPIFDKEKTPALPLSHLWTEAPRNLEYKIQTQSDNRINLKMILKNDGFNACFHFAANRSRVSAELMAAFQALAATI